MCGWLPSAETQQAESVAAVTRTSGSGKVGAVKMNPNRSEIRIRDAVVADALSIREVHQRSVRELCSRDYRPEEIEAWVGPRVAADSGMVMEGSGEYKVVAESGSEIVGFGSVLGQEIVAVYVHPGWGGRGIGGLILGELERHAEKQGARRLHLDSSVTARTFYEGHGYEALEEVFHELATRVAIRAIRMEKSLE